jgi:streptomycin 3"-adenylyltransferase
MKAISEISDLVPELEDDTRNVLLTLARIWHTLETDSIGSKQSSAGWVLERLPEGYKPVVEHALAACLGQTKEDWEKIPRQLIKECADYLINEIHRVESGLDYDKPGKRITVLSS